MRDPAGMHILFVHGMGRSPLSGWPMLHRLRRAGHTVETFAYSVALDDFATIAARLTRRLEAQEGRGEYAVIGHSLGGVLLRAAVGGLAEGSPQPCHLFLLGSPQQPALLAKKLQRNALYRLATRDCGQLLASSARMAGIGAPGIPVTSIVGTLGWRGRLSPFGVEPNDGIVSYAEVSADWLDDVVELRVSHTLLPASRLVAEVVLARLDGQHQNAVENFQKGIG